MELATSQGGRQLITEEAVVLLMAQLCSVAWELFLKAQLRYISSAFLGDVMSLNYLSIKIAGEILFS